MSNAEENNKSHMIFCGEKDIDYTQSNKYAFLRKKRKKKWTWYQKHLWHCNGPLNGPLAKIDTLLERNQEQDENIDFSMDYNTFCR